MAERDGKSALGNDFFIGASERDAISIVRDASKQVLPKRFYRDVSVEEQDGAYKILLDGRPVRTPRQTLLSLPTRAAAELVATEWAAQRDRIDPATMPATRLVNSALDGVAADIGAVAADVAKYAASDLVCYRAAEPAALVAGQSQAWDPVLAFARETLGATFAVAEGVMFASQPPAAISAVARAIDAITKSDHAAFKIAALHVITTMTGSVLLALALEAGRYTPDQVWTAAHVDEDEQMRVWGFDAEALRRRAARFEEFSAACLLLAAVA